MTIEPHVTLERGSYVRPLRCVSVANSMTASGLAAPAQIPARSAVTLLAAFGVEFGPGKR